MLTLKISTFDNLVKYENPNPHGISELESQLVHKEKREWVDRAISWFVKLQMEQQSDRDDAREITALWTYFRENHTVVIGNKHQLHYIGMLPKH